MSDNQSIENLNESGDQLTVGNITDSEAVAQGRGATAIKAGGDVLVFNGPVLFEAFTQARTSVGGSIRLREFRTLIEERTRNFVGREFIFQAIRTLLLHVRRTIYGSSWIVVRISFCATMIHRI